MTRLTRTVIATLSTLGLLAGTAAAQTPKEAPAAKKPATPAAGAPAVPAKPAAIKPAEPAPTAPAPVKPTPPAELLAAAKAMKGTWRCTGSMMVPDGTTKTSSMTITSKLDLDKFWLVTTMTEKKSKTSPFPFKFVSYRSYDAANKKWSNLFMDNMGGYQVSTSSGPGADGIATFEGTMTGMGMSAKAKDMEQMVSPKESKMWGEMSMDGGKTWVKGYEVTCKK